MTQISPRKRKKRYLNSQYALDMLKRQKYQYRNQGDREQQQVGGVFGELIQERIGDKVQKYIDAGIESRRPLMGYESLEDYKASTEYSEKQWYIENLKEELIGNTGAIPRRGHPEYEAFAAGEEFKIDEGWYSWGNQLFNPWAENRPTTYDVPLTDEMANYYIHNEERGWINVNPELGGVTLEDLGAVNWREGYSILRDEGMLADPVYTSIELYEAEQSIQKLGEVIETSGGAIAGGALGAVTGIGTVPGAVLGGGTVQIANKFKDVEFLETAWRGAGKAMEMLGIVLGVAYAMKQIDYLINDKYREERQWVADHPYGVPNITHDTVTFIEEKISGRPDVVGSGFDLTNPADFARWLDTLNAIDPDSSEAKYKDLSKYYFSNPQYDTSTVTGFLGIPSEELTKSYYTKYENLIPLPVDVYLKALEMGASPYLMYAYRIDSSTLNNVSGEEYLKLLRQGADMRLYITDDKLTLSYEDYKRLVKSDFNPEIAPLVSYYADTTPTLFGKPLSVAKRKPESPVRPSKKFG